MPQKKLKKPRHAMTLRLQREHYEYLYRLCSGEGVPSLNAKINTILGKWITKDKNNLDALIKKSNKLLKTPAHLRNNG